MTFSGFNNSDFDVFKIDGFEPRMNALKESIRPKLELLGSHFAPYVSSITGNEFYAHVAKHARRTVNPPKDTWVAFAENPRGYKMLPHFQIGLWETHVFIWFAVIYEAGNKKEFGRKLDKELNTIYEKTNLTFVWSGDHMKPDVSWHQDMSKNDLKELFERLQTVKSAEILCGYQIPRAKAVEMSGDEFIATAENVFKELLYLYKMY